MIGERVRSVSAVMILSWVRDTTEHEHGSSMATWRRSLAAETSKGPRMEVGLENFRNDYIDLVWDLSLSYP